MGVRLRSATQPPTEQCRSRTAPPLSTGSRSYLFSVLHTADSVLEFGAGDDAANYGIQQRLEASRIELSHWRPSILVLKDFLFQTR